MARVTARILYPWTTLSFPSDLGLTAGADYNEPCAMRWFIADQNKLVVLWKTFVRMFNILAARPANDECKTRH
jgi:hypothetical protein